MCEGKKMFVTTHFIREHPIRMFNVRNSRFFIAIKVTPCTPGRIQFTL